MASTVAEAEGALHAQRAACLSSGGQDTPGVFTRRTDASLNNPRRGPGRVASDPRILAWPDLEWADTHMGKLLPATRRALKVVLHGRGDSRAVDEVHGSEPLM